MQWTQENFLFQYCGFKFSDWSISLIPFPFPSKCKLEECDEHGSQTVKSIKSCSSSTGKERNQRGIISKCLAQAEIWLASMNAVKILWLQSWRPKHLRLHVFPTVASGLNVDSIWCKQVRIKCRQCLQIFSPFFLSLFSFLPPSLTSFSFFFPFRFSLSLSAFSLLPSPPSPLPSFFHPFFLLFVFEIQAYTVSRRILPKGLSVSWRVEKDIKTCEKDLLQ